MPIGLVNIGWKMYMVNASWDIIIAVLIVSRVPGSDLHLLISEGRLLGGDQRKDTRGDRCAI
jgi:hypothetical protein